MFDSCCFSQHGVFPCLPTLLKARLKLPLSCRDNLIQNKQKANVLKKLLTISKLWLTKEKKRSVENVASHQDCKVSLWRSANHVGDEALVSGRIEDGEMFLLSLKVRSANLHRLPLVSLLLVCVQSPGQVPVTSMSIQEMSNKKRQGWREFCGRQKHSSSHAHHVSLFFSFASLSYFSSVRLSTIPVKYLMTKNRQPRKWNPWHEVAFLPNKSSL